jgi:ribosomal protein L29
MKITEIKEKNENELKKNLTDLRNKITKMRFDISGKQLKNHREIRLVKKEIAQIMTVFSERKAGIIK